MELATEPDMYSPSVDANGQYVDGTIPPMTHGMRCPCSSKTRVYDTRAKMVAHCHTQCHKKWLESLNNNRSNHLSENTVLKETVASQRLIIADYQTKLEQKQALINELLRELAARKNESVQPQQLNLLDM